MALPMTLAQFRQDVIAPAITKETKITPGATVQLEGATVSVSADTSKPIDIESNEQLCALPVKTVKEQVKGAHATRTQTYTKLNSRTFMAKFKVILDQCDTLDNTKSTADLS